MARTLISVRFPSRQLVAALLLEIALLHMHMWRPRFFFFLFGPAAAQMLFERSRLLLLHLVQQRRCVCLWRVSLEIIGTTASIVITIAMIVTVRG
jgi:hypothetical protein